MKNSLSGYFYCLLLFFISGCVTVIYKLYGADVRTMNETIFCFWTNVILLPFTVLAALKVSGCKMLKEDVKRMGKSVRMIAVATILATNASTLISIQALKMVDIIVYTILKNAFTMLSTILLAWMLMKEKPEMKEWLSIIISIIAVALNSF